MQRPYSTLTQLPYPLSSMLNGLLMTFFPRLCWLPLINIFPPFHHFGSLYHICTLDLSCLVSFSYVFPHGHHSNKITTIIISCSGAAIICHDFCFKGSVGYEILLPMIINLCWLLNVAIIGHVLGKSLLFLSPLHLPCHYFQHSLPSGWSLFSHWLVE